MASNSFPRLWADLTGAVLLAGICWSAQAQELPTVSLTASNTPVPENAGSTTVTATLSATSADPVTIDLLFSGTATQDSDYSVNTAQIIIPPGELSGSLTATAIDDSTPESTEDISIALGAVSGGVPGQPNSIVVQITDDDPPVEPPTVHLSTSATSLSESAGATTVTATLSAASADPVTIDLLFSGTATPGSDYSASAEQISIPAGELSGSLTLTAIDDSSNEANEEIHVSLGSLQAAKPGSPASVSIQLLDNDALPTVTLSIGGTSFAELGGSVSVTATLSAVSGQPVSLPLSFSGTATKDGDYSTSNSQISIPAGQLSASIQLTAIDDTLNEGAERVTVTRGKAVNATSGAPTSVSSQITDNDPVPKVSLAISTASIDESSSGSAVVTASLTAASGKVVTVPLIFSGTATKGSDYSVSAEQIVIPAGATSASITLAVVNDNQDEDAEKITIARGTPSNAGAGAPASVSTSITDDDPLPTVQLAISAASFLEDGGYVNVTASLSAVSGKIVTVPLNFSGAATKNSDYSTTGEQISIAAGRSNASVTISSINDSLDEAAERVTVSIGNAKNAVVGSPRSVAANITDDDPPPTVSLSKSADTLIEQGGAVDVTASLSGPSGQTVSVAFVFEGTAVLGSDYSVSATQLILPAGTTQGTIHLTGIDDALEEPSEQIRAKFGTLTAATAGLKPSLALTIPGTDVADNRPNIVVLLLDDGSQELMDQGAVANYFPNLYQNLYRQGTYFPNYHLATPLCGPSRTSLLRGQFAHNTGIKLNNPPPSEMPPGSPTGGFGEYYSRGYADEDMGKLMHDAGYRSVLIGKYVNNGFPTDVSSNYTPPGWDEFYGVNSGDYFGSSRLINGVRTKNPSTVYRTDQERSEAVQLIGEHFKASTARKPMFLYLAPFSPHSTLSSSGMVASRFADNYPQCVAERTPDFNELDMSDKGSFMQVFPTLDSTEISRIDALAGKRLRSLLATDELFGAVVEALGSELENTYIFFSTDNGFFLGNHRIPSTKLLPYTRGIAAPLVVRGPGVAAGVTRDHLLANVDLLPTFLDIAGSSLPSYIDGKSIIPTLHGLVTPDAFRKSILLENWEGVGVKETDPETDSIHYVSQPAEYVQIRTQTYSYIRWANGDKEYYEFATDPYQLNNQYSSLSAQRQIELDALLDQWKDCSRENCRSAGDVIPP